MTGHSALSTRPSQLPKGYKQTEVGIIPEDWQVKRITDIARLESGHTPSKRNPAYWNGSIQWISLHDTEALDENEIVQTQKTITVEGLNNSSARLLPKGTVVFSRTATVGKVSLMGQDMATSQDFANYICGPGLSNLFLVYLFRGMSSTWKRLMAGSIHNTVYMPVFRELRIPLPPTLAEQEAIAEALSDADALIESLEQLIAKKRLIKQGAMQELLTGKRRLPGFNGEWEVKRLGDCLLSMPGYGINAPAVEFSDHLPMYIRITDITDDGRFAPDPPVSVDHPNSPKYFLENGDVVVARTGASVGKSYRYNPADGPLVFAGFLIQIRPEPLSLDAAFLAHFMQTRVYRSWLAQVSMRTGQPGINGREIMELQIPYPSLHEQSAIASILSDMDAEIVALEERLEKARQIKQGMMQELLTGRVRLVGKS